MKVAKLPWVTGEWSKRRHQKNGIRAVGPRFPHLVLVEDEVLPKHRLLGCTSDRLNPTQRTPEEMLFSDDGECGDGRPGLIDRRGIRNVALVHAPQARRLRLDLCDDAKTSRQRLTQLPHRRGVANHALQVGKRQALLPTADGCLSCGDDLVDYRHRST